VFAVLQHNPAIIYILVHPLNVIVGDGTIDMIHQKIDVVGMAAAAAVVLLVLKVSQVHLQHPNDIRKPTI
jgi:hypothetical protein